MPTKLPGESVLDIDNVVLPIEMTGDKKGRGCQHELLLDHSIRVAQADILLPFVLNRECVDVSQGWQCHGWQAYPKWLVASTLPAGLIPYARPLWEWQA